MCFVRLAQIPDMILRPCESSSNPCRAAESCWESSTVAFISHIPPQDSTSTKVLLRVRQCALVPDALLLGRSGGLEAV